MENKTDFPPFYSGQKVVCINDATRIYPYICTDKCEVKRGSIYTIDKIMINNAGAWLCTILEIPTPNGWGFYSERFAPIESQFQSISFEKVVEIESPLIGVN